MDNIDFIDDENILSVPSEIEAGSYEDDSIGSSIFTISGKSTDNLAFTYEPLAVAPAPTTVIFTGKSKTNFYGNGNESNRPTENRDNNRLAKNHEELNANTNTNTLTRNSRLKSRCRWSLPYTGTSVATGSHRYQLPFWLTSGIENDVDSIDKEQDPSRRSILLVRSDPNRNRNFTKSQLPNYDLPLPLPLAQHEKPSTTTTATPSLSPYSSSRTETGTEADKSKAIMSSSPSPSPSTSEAVYVSMDVTGIHTNHFQNQSQHLNLNSKSKGCKETCSVGWMSQFGNFLGALKYNSHSDSAPDIAAKNERRRRMMRWLRDWLLVYPSIAFCVWAFIYILCGQRLAFPNGGLFNLFVLEVLAIVMGYMCESVQLPGLLGMVGAGLIIRNGHLPFISGDYETRLIQNSVSNPLRAMSVVVLLTRGALCVSPEAIKNFWRIVPHLAVMSCVVEAVVASCAVYFIIGFPPAWAALMGCIMSAMSGAVVMPYLAALAAKVGCASENKVIAIARTACGLDAILAICMAEFALGFIFANGELSAGFRKGVVEVIMGGAFGLLWGSMAGFLLDGGHCIELRTFAMFSGGVLSLLGLTAIGYPRGGPLGVFAGSLVAACIWRHKRIDGKNNDQMQANFTKLWFYFQPLLFGIIGIRTNFTLVNWFVVSQGMLCLAISLSARLLTSFAMCSCVPLTWRQKLFIVITWIPKGTVQAALGPVALETILSLNYMDDNAKILGHQVMNIAVATIILASSVGALCLILLGKPLLVKKAS